MTNTNGSERQRIPVIRELWAGEGPPDGDDMLLAACRMMTRGDFGGALELAGRMRDDVVARDRSDTNNRFPTHGIWCGFIIAARAAWFGGV